MINPYLTVISQYANSPALLSLIDTFNEAVDPRALVEVFYDKIWNVDTAEGYGLDLWGRIVGIDRSFQILKPPRYSGFAEAYPGVTSFGFGPLYGGQPLREPYTITDDDVFRRLILAKAATNLTDGSISSVNQILLNFFHDRGNVYVREEPHRRYRYLGFAEAGGADGFDGLGAFGDFLGFRPSTMSITYVFNFRIEPYERHLVLYSTAFPRVAGVHAAIEVNA
jgi:hypothetical protein